MRSTLHLVDAEDLAWLHPLFAPRMVTANERRLRAARRDRPGRTRTRIVAALPATRAELAAQFDLARPGARRTRCTARPPRYAGGAALPRRARPATRCPRRAARVVPLDLAARAGPRRVSRRARPPLLRVPRRRRPSATSPTGPGSRCATAAHPPSDAIEDGPVARRAHPDVRRAPARLARPLTHRPGRARQARPSGRRDPARGHARGRRRRRHVVARRRPGQRRTF